MHSKNNNIDIIIGHETEEIIKKLFGSLSQKHQKGLDKRMRGSELFLIMLIHCITNFIK